MPLSTDYGARHFPDRISFADIGLPAEVVDNTAIAADAALEASKLQHQHILRYSQLSGTEVVQETHILRICEGTGVVNSVETVAAIIPTADLDFYTIMVRKIPIADRTTPVDCLSAVITYNNTIAVAVSATYAILTGELAVLADRSFVDGDIIDVVVTVTDNGGTNAKGVGVNVKITEAA